MAAGTFDPSAAILGEVLDWPDTTMAPHFDRTALKVGGTTFATLGDAPDLNLRLPAERVDALLAAGTVHPLGGWTKHGWVGLPLVDAAAVEVALDLAREAWELRRADNQRTRSRRRRPS